MTKVDTQRFAEALYIESARILKRIEEKQGSAKGLIYGSKFKNKKKLYAIVYEVLKCMLTVLVHITCNTHSQYTNQQKPTQISVTAVVIFIK